MAQAQYTTICLKDRILHMRNMGPYRTTSSPMRGEKGNTIFYYPYVDIETRNNAKEIAAFIRKLGDAKDDRLFAVLSALVIEHHLDKLLSLLIRDFDKKFGEGVFLFARK